MKFEILFFKLECRHPRKKYIYILLISMPCVFKEKGGGGGLGEDGDRRGESGELNRIGGMKIM